MSTAALQIGLVGFSGRMGQSIVKSISEEDGAVLSSGLVRKPDQQSEQPVFLSQSVDAMMAHADVIIDFSAPSLTAMIVEKAAVAGKPLLCGTTGIDEAARIALENAAEKIPVIHATNTSLSLVVMKKLVQQASALLQDQDYDISILDVHHRMKKDAPSGTAKTLGEYVLKGNNHKHTPAFSAIRAGYVVGEHEVMFAGHDEIVSIKHVVTDRAVFARGAVKAILWLAQQKPGAYAMDDVLSF